MLQQNTFQVRVEREMSMKKLMALHVELHKHWNICVIMEEKKVTDTIWFSAVILYILYFTSIRI